MTPHRVFIVGHEGTTGLRIHERLSDRKDIELLATADEDRKSLELQLVGHMGSQNLVKATKQILQLKNILQILAVMRAV